MTVATSAVTEAKYVGERKRERETGDRAYTLNTYTIRLHGPYIIESAALFSN